MNESLTFQTNVVYPHTTQNFYFKKNTQMNWQVLQIG